MNIRLCSVLCHQPNTRLLISEGFPCAGVASGSNQENHEAGWGCQGKRNWHIILRQYLLYGGCTEMWNKSCTQQINYTLQKSREIKCTINMFGFLIIFNNHKHNIGRVWGKSNVASAFYQCSHHSVPMNDLLDSTARTVLWWKYYQLLFIQQCLLKSITYVKWVYIKA